MPESNGKDQMDLINERMRCDLDSKGTDSSNHVQRPTEHAIVREIRIVFPNGTSSFHSCNFCDVAHYVDGGKINNMAKASETRIKMRTVTGN
jgi:hypothetical protein